MLVLPPICRRHGLCPRDGGGSAKRPEIASEEAENLPQKKGPRLFTPHFLHDASTHTQTRPVVYYYYTRPINGETFTAFVVARNIVMQASHCCCCKQLLGGFGPRGAVCSKNFPYISEKCVGLSMRSAPCLYVRLHASHEWCLLLWLADLDLGPTTKPVE